MRPTVQTTPCINTLSPKPGVIVWYARIPDIIQRIFHAPRSHSFTSLKNENFHKEAFITPFFSQGEIKTINSFKAMKKQIEWISGRYIVKQMIQHNFLQTSCLDRITISYLEQGAPFITRHPDISISLSHSNDYTAAVCCNDKNKPLGIDIEKIAKKPDAGFLKTAFTQNEIKNLKDDAQDIFKHWTIKEAYLKYIKKGFNESLHNVEVINNEIWHNKNKIHVDVQSIRIDGYILSLVSD